MNGSHPGTQASLTNGRELASPSSAGIELWNVHDGVTTVVGSQERLCIVGRLADASEVERLTYVCNGGPERPVVFRASPSSAAPTRLTGIGDFSIDTIAPGELQPHNVLRLTATTHDGRQRTREVAFPVAPVSHPDTNARLDLDGSEHPQEVCQLVDGRWRLATDEQQRPCLRISPADAGLDRVALFTRPITAPAYTVSVRLRIDQWMRGLHNVGLLYAWRGHQPGDGHELPPNWTTGLGYYYSHCPGLRLRVGENVHVNAEGRKVGDTVLAESPVSRPRALVARATRKLAGGTLLRQIPANKDYWFRLRVTPARYLLSVWPDGHDEPSPQVVAATDQVAPLPGAAGVIAHYCAVSVYEFSYQATPEAGP